MLQPPLDDRCRIFYEALPWLFLILPSMIRTIVPMIQSAETENQNRINCQTGQVATAFPLVKATLCWYPYAIPMRIKWNSATRGARNTRVQKVFAATSARRLPRPEGDRWLWSDEACLF